MRRIFSIVFFSSGAFGVALLLHYIVVFFYLSFFYLVVFECATVRLHALAYVSFVENLMNIIG